MAQKIGIDVGRGYTNGYTVYECRPYECMFQSIVGTGRPIDINTKIKDPMYIGSSNRKFFVGELAHKESYQKIPNLTDDKTELAVEILIIQVLNKLAKQDKVSIMLGVPYKLFRKSVRDKIKAKYKGKTYTIKDFVSKTTKVVTIDDIDILREADASFLWYTRELDYIDKPIGMVNVGFRTMEMCYYDKDFEYNDSYSKSIELGNKNVLQNISNDIATSDKKIMLDLYDIDKSDDFDDLKDMYYEILKHQIYTAMEDTWINQETMDIFFAGGTVRHLGDLRYPTIPDAEMSVAKGLWYALEEMSV